MEELHKSTLSAINRRLNEYLRLNNIQSPHMLSKIKRVKIFCEFENKPIPTRKMINNFLIEEYKNPLSKISSLIKTPSAKTKKKVYNERKIEYADYINSQKWKSFRLSIIKERGYKCEKCGANNRIIHAHHLTYERFMKELPEDIQLLCVLCHKEVHNKKLNKKIKIISNKRLKKNELEKNNYLFERDIKKIYSRYKSNRYNILKANSLIESLINWYNNKSIDNKKYLESYIIPTN